MSQYDRAEYLQKIDIYCKYEGYGYVAKSPDVSDQKTQRHAGPRAASEELASAVFGKGNYVLLRRSYKIYVATKSTKTVPK